DIFAHDLTKGNSIMLQLLLDGMKLQPCNPTFIDARDAIIQAENNLTGGKNKCAIWAAFAKRGLGVNAPRSDGGSHTDDSTRPPKSDDFADSCGKGSKYTQDGLCVFHMEDLRIGEGEGVIELCPFDCTCCY
ncbi:hypothetical protein GGI19_006084, partial [Coemansia pectinata]